MLEDNQYVVVNFPDYYQLPDEDVIYINTYNHPDDSKGCILLVPVHIFLNSDLYVKVIDRFYLYNSRGSYSSTVFTYSTHYEIGGQRYEYTQK